MILVYSTFQVRVQAPNNRYTFNENTTMEVAVDQGSGAVTGQQNLHAAFPQGMAKGAGVRGNGVVMSGNSFYITGKPTAF
jgi:hypothetical protein